MNLLAELIVGFLKLMVLGLGLVFILGGGYCVLLPLADHSSDSLGFAGIGAVMLVLGVVLWWAIIRASSRKGGEKEGAVPFAAEASETRPDIDRPWERR